MKKPPSVIIVSEAHTRHNNTYVLSNGIQHSYVFSKGIVTLYSSKGIIYYQKADEMLDRVSTAQEQYGASILFRTRAVFQPEKRGTHQQHPKFFSRLLQCVFLLWKSVLSTQKQMEVASSDFRKQLAWNADDSSRVVYGRRLLLPHLKEGRNQKRLLAYCMIFVSFLYHSWYAFVTRLSQKYFQIHFVMVMLIPHHVP